MSKHGIIEDEAKGNNRVPLWDGKPENFQHYVQEIRWYLAATKATDRAYAAARLVRRMLDSEYTALRTLMYKLNPEDFGDEAGIQRLVQFLENSPMNRQPIPDAGAKLSQYYRKLNRRSNETIPQFLVREDCAYDSMWRSLKRLLREKAIDFSGYEITEAELKVFCGMKPEESFFYGNGEPEFEDPMDDVPSQRSQRSGQSFRTERVGEENPFGDPDRPSGSDHSEGSQQRHGSGPQSRSSGRDSQHGPPKSIPKKSDLIDRLMQKGLIPLAALDVIRGWMLLEATSSSETDKQLVKAATQNQIGYQAIRSALLALHEDRERSSDLVRPRPRHHAHWTDDWDDGDLDETYGNEHYYADDSWNNDSWNDDAMYANDNGWEEEHAEDEPNANDPDDAEHGAMMSQLCDEERNLQAMLADTQRSLAQARQAVAEAKRDRGWQGHPGGGKSKPTSTFMSKGKGKSKSTGKSSSPAVFNFPQKGSSAMWSSKDNYKGKGKKSFSFSKFRSPQSGWYHESYESGMLAIDSDHEDALMMSKPMKTSVQSPSSSSQWTDPGGPRGVVDTGATVSAGGKQAVQEMVESLASIRPDLKVTVVQGDKPYFRYGSGQWGQALFRVDMQFGGVIFSVYSLPSENVPVLVGMRELRTLSVGLHCGPSRAIIKGQPRILKRTRKGHLLLDLTADISCPDDLKSSRHSSPAKLPSDRKTRSQKVEFSGMLEVESEFECVQDFHVCNVQFEADDSRLVDFSRFMDVSQDQWNFLSSADPSCASDQSVPCHNVELDGRAQEHAEGHRQGGFGRREVKGILKQRSSSCQGQIQTQEHPSVRRDQNHVSSSGFRSTPEEGSVAMLCRASTDRQQQSMGQVERMCGMRTSSVLYPVSGQSSDLSQNRLESECDHGSGKIEDRWMDSRDTPAQHCEADDQVGGRRTCDQDQTKDREVQGSSEETSERDRGVGSEVRRFVSEGQPREEGHLGDDDCQDEWQEVHWAPLNLDQKRSLSASVSENWTSFDAAHSVRDLRGYKDGQGEHLWEICCSPNSALSNEMMRQGFKATRLTYETNFDLSSTKKVDQTIALIPHSQPTRVWASPRCTAVSSIQNLNQKTPEQKHELYKKRLKTVREVRNLIRIFKAAFARNPGSTHLYFEWPKTAHWGWNMKEWKELQQWLWSKFGQRVYWTEMHGCMFGLKDQHGETLNKPWVVMTTDFDFSISARTLCDGTHKHQHIVGIGSQAVQSTAFYPDAMVRRIVQIWKKQWFHSNHLHTVKQLHVMKRQDAEFQNVAKETLHYSQDGFAVTDAPEEDAETPTTTVDEVPEREQSPSNASSTSQSSRASYKQQPSKVVQKSTHGTMDYIRSSKFRMFCVCRIGQGKSEGDSSFLERSIETLASGCDGCV